MYLQSIELHGFRNFGTAHFDFNPGVNIVFGPNGVGKTNLLEAIHVLSNLRSFRTHLIRELITWDAAEGSLRGVILAEEKPNTFSRAKTLALRLKPNAREFLVNTKPCTSSKEYLQIFPSVGFNPDDLSLVKGSPSSRRYFLDRGTFHFSPSYWSLLTEYNRALKQRNALLRENLSKHGGRNAGASVGSIKNSLKVWESQLQTLGSKIILQRLRFIHHLHRQFTRIYQQWMDNTETVELRYSATIGAVEEILETHDICDYGQHQHLYEQIFQLYEQGVRKNQKREYRQATTLIGPHRDDLDLQLWGKSLKAYGSQGQQRTAVLALKLAEAHLYNQQYAEYPILLLDDVTSELDIWRNTRLLACLQQGMQVFLSATEKPDFSSFHKMPCSYIELPQTAEK